MKKLLLGITALSGIDLFGMDVATIVEEENQTKSNFAPMSDQGSEKVTQDSIRPDQFPDGVDPHSPIYEMRNVPYQVWVQSGYETSQNGLAGLFGGSRWVDTSHLETRYRTEKVVVGYEPLTTAEAII